MRCLPFYCGVLGFTQGAAVPDRTRTTPHVTEFAIEDPDGCIITCAQR